MTQLYMPLPTTNTVVENKGTEIMELMLLGQYADAANLKEYIGAFVGEMDLLFAETERVYLGRMLEYATDDSLDTIGIILDQPRGINLPTQFFGFFGAPSVAGMADESIPQDGGVFRSEGQSDTSNYVLSDGEYRRLLTAKAMLTTRDECSPNNIYFILSTLLGHTPRVLQLLTAATSSAPQNFNGQFSSSTAGWDALYTAYNTIGVENGMAWADSTSFYAGMTSNTSTLIEVVATQSYELAMDVIHSTGIGSTMYLVALDDTGAELDSWTHKSTADNEAYSFSETLTPAVYTGEVTLVAYEDRTQRAAYTQGNNSVKGTFDNTIALTGDFDIEFTWERTDRSGTGISRILGDAGTGLVLVYDSGHATNPDRIIFIVDGAFKNWYNVLGDIAQGQFIKIRFTRVGSTISLYIDGVKDDTEYFGSGTVSFSELITSGHLRGVLADLTIIDGTDTISYPLDETSGLPFYAYDENGASYSQYDGTWDAENKLLDPTATLSSGKTYFDNITVVENVTVSARNIDLRLSAKDTSLSDKSLIEYFSQYLFPLGTGFTVTRI